MNMEDILLSAVSQILDGSPLYEVSEIVKILGIQSRTVVARG